MQIQTIRLKKFGTVQGGGHQKITKDHRGGRGGPSKDHVGSQGGGGHGRPPMHYKRAKENLQLS